MKTYYYKAVPFGSSWQVARQIITYDEDYKSIVSEDFPFSGTLSDCWAWIQLEKSGQF